MHVLRQCYNRHYVEFKGEGNDIPLNEKDLLSVYKAIEAKVEPVRFIAELLYYRIILDRYLVRREGDTNDPKKEDGKWSLQKPCKNTQSNGVYPKETFGSAVNEHGKTKQDNVVKALSMLQVSYPQQKYKNYLYEILSWFKFGKVDYTYEWYMPRLNNLINEFMDGIEKAYENDPKKDLYSLGTSTPRFVLNLVDYLYYLKEDVSDFDFRYYNSVEHHLAQSSKMYRIEDADYIDQIGNLFLLSRRRNSSLNDGDPLIKAKKVKSLYPKFATLPPNRKLIYSRTCNNNSWNGKVDIKQHTAEIMKLLKDRSNILDIKMVLPEAPEIEIKSETHEEVPIQKDVDYYRACLSVRNYCPVYGQSQEGTRYNFHDLSTPLGVEAEEEVKGWLKANPDRNIQDFISEQLEHNEDLKAEPWRWLLVSDRSAMEYCQEGIFILSDDEEAVYLLAGVRKGKYAQELRVKECVLVMKLREEGHEAYFTPESGVDMSIGPSTFSNRFPHADVTLYVYLDSADWHYGVMSTRKANANENKALIRSGWTKN